ETDALFVECDGAVVIARRVRDRAEVVQHSRRTLALAQLRVERNAALEKSLRILELALVVRKHTRAVERLRAQLRRQLRPAREGVFEPPPAFAEVAVDAPEIRERAREPKARLGVASLARAPQDRSEVVVLGVYASAPLTRIGPEQNVVGRRDEPQEPIPM